MLTTSLVGYDCQYLLEVLKVNMPKKSMEDSLKEAFKHMIAEYKKEVSVQPIKKWIEYKIIDRFTGEQLYKFDNRLENNEMRCLGVMI